MTCLFSQGNKTLRVTIQLYKFGESKDLKHLVSEHSVNFTSKPHNSVNFQPIFTNKVSESKLRGFSIQ